MISLIKNEQVQNLGIATAAAAVATVGSMWVNGAALTVAPLSLAGLAGTNVISTVAGAKLFGNDNELTAKNVAKVALAAILLNAATSKFALSKLSKLPVAGSYLEGLGSDALRAGSNAALFTALTALKMYLTPVKPDADPVKPADDTKPPATP